MAVRALWHNAVDGTPSYDAKALRQAMSALAMPGPSPLRSRSGFRPGGAPTVTVNATTWTVGPFSAVIDTGQSSVTAPYLVASDATESNNPTGVQPAHSSWDRKDILYIQVDDADESDGSGQRRARVLYLAGTASATPVAPSTPARSLLIGTIDVPRSSGGNPSFTPSRQIFVAAGGIVPVANIAERNALTPYDGLVVDRADAPWGMEVYRGGWRPAQGDAVLGELWHGQGLAYTIKSNATNGRADIDPALTLTFTAPDTGRVWVELEGTGASTGVTPATGRFGTYWCLRDGGGALVPNSTMAMLPAADVPAQRLRYQARITGLTPGQQYTYTWQHFRGAGTTGTAWFYFGGDSSIYSLMRVRRAT